MSSNSSVQVGQQTSTGKVVTVNIALDNSAIS
jgi:hypothetical protein